MKSDGVGRDGTPGGHHSLYKVQSKDQSPLELYSAQAAQLYMVT